MLENCHLPLRAGIDSLNGTAILLPIRMDSFHSIAGFLQILPSLRNLLLHVDAESDQRCLLAIELLAGPGHEAFHDATDFRPQGPL